MASARVCILGGGFGGLAAAHALRSSGAEVALTVIDRAPDFRMGLRNLWQLDGRSGVSGGSRPRAALSDLGIDFRQVEITAIDLDRRTVTAGGDSVDWDFLVVALGAEPREDLVPGDPQAACDLYTAEGAQRAADTLQGLRRGRVVIAIAGLPYRCPPAPYEASFVIDGMLRERALRDQFEIAVTSPQAASMPAAGPLACNVVEGRLSARRIDFHPNAPVEAIEARSVRAGGEAFPADLILYVPPHRPPRAVAESGLTGGGGWVPADPGDLHLGHERVYAIGDLVEMKTGSGMPFPKAGVFAEAHGRVVGANIAALVTGAEPSARFDGHGFCFLETGSGVASMVRGDFLASPPRVEVAPDAAEHLQAKVEFERERLERWLPTASEQRGSGLDA